MTPEDYKRYVESIQDQYAWLHLTYEQAEQVYQYERDKRLPFSNHYFSAWEEWDYELTIFRQILHKDQLTVYESNLKETIASHERFLAKEDKRSLKEIAYHEELFHFYETRFLPAFFEDLNTLLMANTLLERNKVDYIRTEYKHYMATTQKEILTSHFRNYRTFQPNLLKLSLLRHSLSYLVPNYRSFKHQMDEPTKAVAQFLKNKFRYAMTNAEELLIQQEKELTAFSESLIKKYSINMGGWHVYGEELTEEEKKEERILTLILLDRNKYGLQNSV